MQNNIIKLNITDLSNQGLGIARQDDGKVVMVNNALPGESVLARPLEERKGFNVAQCLEVLTTSPDRVEPPCPYLGQCGGCDLQHLSYPAQLKFKQQWLVRLLRDFTPLPAIKVVESKLPLGYRHRIRLHYDGPRPGFYARQSHELVPIDQCLLACDKMRAVWHELPNMPGLEEVELLADDEQVYASLKGDGLKRQEAGSGNLLLHWPGQEPELDTGLVYYQKNGLTLKAWPGQFSQVNWQVNEEMISTLLEFSAPFIGCNSLVYDLFSGSGNLSLPLSQNGAKVVAVEGSAFAARAGQYQAQKAGLDCTFINAPVHTFLKKTKDKNIDLLVLDPPRAGAKRIIQDLTKLQPKAICYISCHPAAMARDLRGFRQSGYQLRQLALMDMFPQTGQMEIVSLLVK